MTRRNTCASSVPVDDHKAPDEGRGRSVCPHRTGEDLTEWSGTLRNEPPEPENDEADAPLDFNH